MENAREVPQKIKNTPAIWSSIFTLVYLPEENNIVNWKRNMYFNIHHRIM